MNKKAIFIRGDKENNYYNKKSYSRIMIMCTVIVCAFIAVYLIYDYNSQFRFSVKPGFYEDSFDLKIFGSKGYDVYYTLDGSTPTIASLKYNGAIMINDRSSEPNAYAQRTDVTTGFLSDEIEQFSSDNPHYVAPQYNVDKCTVVRAALFDKQRQCIEEISGIYFVGDNLKEKYEDIMIVSIVTEPENLFDYDNGIFVTGRDFDDYWENFDISGDDYEWWEVYWKLWPANYRRKGSESEREARIDIIDNNSEVLSQSCGIRVQGNGSRGKLPRNIKLISREEYSGSRYFQKDILGKGLDLHKCVLFGGADDNIFKIKDYLSNTMESELNFATMDFKPCVCFVEGEYWGTYYLTEDYDKYYFQAHYGVPSDDVIIWKEGEINEGTLEDLDLYAYMESFISENDMSIEENYAKACEMIDINSFADYFAAQIFIGRCGDWPGGNIGAWRSRGVNVNSKYQDGRWRWMLYDVNSVYDVTAESQCLDYNLLEDDTLDYVLGCDSLFASLIKNDSFKQLFCDRIKYIENKIYSEDKINDFIDSYYENMLKMLCLSNQRFYGDEQQEDIIANAENIRTFLLERHKFIDKSIREHFGEEYFEQ